MESTLKSINLTAESLTPGPDPDICLMQQLEKQVDRIKGEDSNITCDNLSLELEDRYLLGLSLAPSETLFDLSIQIKRLVSLSPTFLLHQQILLIFER